MFKEILVCVYPKFIIYKHFKVAIAVELYIKTICINEWFQTHC